MEQNRRSFLKLLGLATACAIVDPIIPDVLVAPKGNLITIRQQARFLKVTQEMVKDTPFMKSFLIREGLKLSGNDPEWEKKTTIDVGYHGDGFVRNLTTVRLTYAHTSEPT